MPLGALVCWCLGVLVGVSYSLTMKGNADVSTYHDVSKGITTYQKVSRRISDVSGRIISGSVGPLTGSFEIGSRNGKMATMNNFTRKRAYNFRYH